MPNRPIGTRAPGEQQQEPRVFVLMAMSAHRAHVMDHDIAAHRQKRRRPTPTGWDDLPDELVLRVASLLDMRSVALLGCVDHRTRDVCLDNRLWRRFYYVGDADAAAHAGQVAAHKDVVAQARAWLANPTDLTDPTRAWNRVLAADMLAHADDLEAEDHRWACALRSAHRGTPRCFARWPDVPPCALAEIRDLDLTPLEVSPSGLPPTKRRAPGVRSTYRGGVTIREGVVVPHGSGVAISTAASGAVVCKIIGDWEHGLPSGKVRAWSTVYQGHVDYYEGDCVGGRAHGHGILVTYFDSCEGRWADGFLCGPSLVRAFGRHIVHTASSPGHRGGRIPAIIYRNDGSLAFKGLCDASGSACNGLVFAPPGDTLVYDGKVLDYDKMLGGGMVYLDDGTTIAGRFDQDSCMETDICITYPNGDAVHCRRPVSLDANVWIPEAITRFTFSSSSSAATVDPTLAGRTIDGPWHILAVGRRGQTPPAGYAFPCVPRQWRGRPPVMTVTLTSTGRKPEPESGPRDKALVAARALGTFVFWPRSTGLDERQRLDRERFFEHMIAHHGSHWATCRRLAAATPW
ncbi:F-box domain containing protein [Pandoravirus japonicus]|uniref:F-box domain containing protein n=1 Tax=Pandoravirus japonicus TaxID=2823154 RepID=A0A811BTM5_9VIRU|nr:F-box domain containing protein [Pandoravirus japonicus]